MGDRFEEMRKRVHLLTIKEKLWLIEQAELAGLAGHFAQKNGELNVFLNKYSEPKHFGKNVIDVAMDIIAKQSERVQELEQEKDDMMKLVNYHKEQQKKAEDENEPYRHESKRYREALKWYSENSPHGNIADEALGEESE